MVDLAWSYIKLVYAIHAKTHGMVHFVGCATEYLHVVQSEHVPLFSVFTLTARLEVLYYMRP